MSEQNGHSKGLEFGVLLLAPTGRDAELTSTLLAKAGVPAVICRDLDSMSRSAAKGVGAILMAEEAITIDTQQMLAKLIDGQPPWSDLPVLIVTRPGADSATVLEALETSGNVTILERPIRVAALVSAVRTALRSRRRQYELRDRLEAQALQAAIVASTDDAIVSKTLQGTILSWNAGAERIFGYTAAEAVGQPITLIIPPDRHAEERMILDRMIKGERLEHFETVRVAKDGRLIEVSLTISPVRDITGRIIGASKIARDITVQKRTEEALREADRRKDEFLAMLAHELRNPLAPIRNSLHILQLAGQHDAGVDRVRAMMERQVDQMVRLVDDLMEVSRITRGKIELRKERVDLGTIVRSAIETSQPLIDAASHQLIVSLPTEPLVVEADPVRLAQVFSNLVNNAAKYSETPSQIRLTARREGDTAVVSVRDYGIGIAREMLPRVFEMFTQIDRTGQHNQGLGIGLALVRTLVQMHGGSVTATSPGLGKGSEFTVRLQLAEGPARIEERPPEHSEERLLVRVLVVDDNVDAADSLGMLLRLLGAEALVVHDGSSALRALHSFEPDLVLLDLGMPRMDGYEVARRIRRQPEFQHITIIAMTGWGQEEDRRRTKAAGFDHHLIKPANVDALQALMASVVAKHEHR